MVSVGRRSGPTKLYAMRRTDYEAWLASYQPPSDNYEDKALRELFGSSKVHVCDVAPTQIHEIDSDDRREQVVEVLRAVSIDDARCHLESTSALEPSAAGLGSSKQAKGGCAGCHSSPAGARPWGAWVGLLAMLLIGRRARRRPRGRRAVNAVR